jgi:hypothetical protein
MAAMCFDGSRWKEDFSKGPQKSLSCNCWFQLVIFCNTPIFELMLHFHDKYESKNQP